MDWCKRCGDDIYQVPSTMAWYNRDGRFACKANALRAHTPLIDTTDAEMLSLLKSRHAR